jgi:kynurenine formamidase
MPDAAKGRRRYAYHTGIRSGPGSRKGWHDAYDIGSDKSSPMSLDASVISALRIATRGFVYDLGSGWWRKMPGADPHPVLEVLTYRSPRGQQIERDISLLDSGANEVGYGFVSELVIGTTHTGTHIDALCHVTCGPDSSWHGGGSADHLLGDFGAREHDASRLEPIVARGVLLDIPRLLGVDALQPAQAIGSNELDRAGRAQGVDVREGDVVLVRTGQMRYWPEPDRMAAVDGAGVSLDGARWLSDRRVRAVGADTVCLELQPSGIAGDPQPVHLHLIREHGIPIIEWVNCEEIARDEVDEFLFIALPLSIRGATGSMLRPIAVI